MRRPFYKTKGKANGKERRTRPHLATEANSFSQNQRASGHCNKNGTSRVEVNKNGDSSEPKAEAQAIQKFKMESQANPRPYTYIIYIYILSYHQVISGRNPHMPSLELHLCSPPGPDWPDYEDLQSRIGKHL